MTMMREEFLATAARLKEAEQAVMTNLLSSCGGDVVERLRTVYGLQRKQVRFGADLGGASAAMQRMEGVATAAASKSDAPSRPPFCRAP